MVMETGDYFQCRESDALVQVTSMKGYSTRTSKLPMPNIVFFKTSDGKRVGKITYQGRSIVIGSPLYIGDFNKFFKKTRVL